MNTNTAGALIIIGIFALLVLIHLAPGRWRRWRAAANCFHHDRTDPDISSTWIKSQLIDMGSRKMYWCTHCEKTWIF